MSNKKMSNKKNVFFEEIELSEIVLNDSSEGDGFYEKIKYKK